MSYVLPTIRYDLCAVNYSLLGIICVLCITHCAIRVDLQLIEVASTKEKVLFQIWKGELTQAGDGVLSIGKLCYL